MFNFFQAKNEKFRLLPRLQSFRRLQIIRLSKVLETRIGLQI